MAVYGVSCAISMIIHHFGYFGGAFFPIYRGKIVQKIDVAKGNRNYFISEREFLYKSKTRQNKNHI